MTDTLPLSPAPPPGTAAQGDPHVHDDRLVEEQLEESFPASDPPGSNRFD